jgi:hypothetical protein
MIRAGDEVKKKKKNETFLMRFFYDSVIANYCVLVEFFSLLFFSLPRRWKTSANKFVEWKES